MASDIRVKLVWQEAEHLLLQKFESWEIQTTAKVVNQGFRDVVESSS